MSRQTNNQQENILNKSLKQALNNEWISINRLSNKKKITKILTVKRDQPNLLSSNFTQKRSEKKPIKK